MLSPERVFQAREQHEPPLSMVEEAVYNAYVPAWRAAEPRLDDFEGTYTREEIDRDKEFVERRKGLETDKHERAQLLEALLFNAMDQWEWLGERAYVSRTSEYDDRVSGTDFVIEFLSDDGTIKHLAVDVTVARNRDTLRTKAEREKKGFRGGRLTNIKYFSSELIDPTLSERGDIYDLPRVIVGIGPESLQLLAKSFARLGSEDPQERKTAASIIEKHPFQNLLIEQIRLQLLQELSVVPSLVPKGRQELIMRKINEVLVEIEAIEAEKEKAPPAWLQRDRTAHLLSDKIQEIWA